jgi:predicted Zn-dependent protease
MHHAASRLRTVCLAGAATLALGACASVPGSGLPTGAPITPSEAQQGAQYHPQFLAEFGGEFTGPQASYVEQIGDGIAVQSGMAASPDSFKFTTLNSSVNNAFAVPGGYIYVSRQLVALMNNEAELAGVLGHEVGHVAARHTARRQETAQRNQLLGVLGAVLSGAVLGGSQLGNTVQQGILQGSQALTLTYSRGQEIEADELGIRYLGTAGYDPRAMATLLQSLAAQDALDAQLEGRNDATIPEWASTHPDPASRVRNALDLAGGATGVTNRETFLTRINGLLYGDDPAQGVIEGRQFLHPQLRLAFAAPQGFYMVNSTSAVSINGDAGRAQLAGAQYGGDIDGYVRQVFQALGGGQQALTPQQIERTTVNGLPAAYATVRVNNQQGQVDVTVFAYEFSRSQAFHFASITPAGGAGVFNEMYGSMRRLAASEASAIVPRRIDVVTAGRGDSVRSLAQRMAYDSAQEARFRVLNGLQSSDEVVPGQQYKIVVRTN